jgi:hypothetical protein
VASSALAIFLEAVRTLAWGRLFSASWLWSAVLTEQGVRGAIGRDSFAPTVQVLEGGGGGNLLCYNFSRLSIETQ